MIIKNGEILAIDHIAHDNTLSGNGTSAKPVGLSQSTKDLIDSKVKKTDFETYKSSAANQISNINTKITTDESNFESYKSSAHDEIARIDSSIATVNAAKVDKTTFTQYQTDVANNFTAVNKRIDDVDAAKVSNTTFEQYQVDINNAFTAVDKRIDDVDAAKQDKGEYVSASDFNTYKTNVAGEIAKVDGRIDTTNTNLENNYYKKNQTYSQSEIDKKFADFGGYKFREADPEHNNQPILNDGEEADPKAIYLTQPEDEDQYLQWVCEEEHIDPPVWKCIGDTTMDLKDYAKTVDVVASANANKQEIEAWANNKFETSADFNAVIAGYYTKSEVNTELATKVDNADFNAYKTEVNGKFTNTSAWTNEKFATKQNLIDTKAELEDTIELVSGDIISKVNTDYGTLNGKIADIATTLSNNYYTSLEIDDILAASGEYYTKTESDDKYTVKIVFNTAINELSSNKLDKSATVNWDVTEYTEGENIKIVGHEISGKDWSDEIEAAVENKVDKTEFNDLDDEVGLIGNDLDTLSGKTVTVIKDSETVKAIRSTELDGTISYTLSAHDGKQADYLWKPTVNAAGDISWELALTGDTPDPANIKGPQGIQGVSGTPGKDGENGITPKLKIDEDDIWNVSYDNEATWTSLGVSATGPKGETGAQGPQGIQGIQGVSGTPGKDGKNGITPHIGDNNHWFIGDYDTEVSATGPQGPQGEEGHDGDPGFSPTVDAVAITDGEKTGTEITFTYKDAQGQTQTTVYSAWNGVNGEGATIHFDGIDGIEITPVDTTHFNIGLSAAYKTQVEDVSGKLDASDLVGYATEQYVQGAIAEVTAWVNGQGYLKSIPSEYITETELANYNYATISLVQEASAYAYDAATADANSKYVATTDLLTAASNKLTGIKVGNTDYTIQETDWTNTIQDASAKAFNDATANANTTYVTKTSAATEFVNTSSWANTTFQPKGNYVATADLITAAGNTLTGIKVGSTNYIIPDTGITEVKHNTSLIGDGNANNLGVAWSALSGYTITSALSANSASYAVALGTTASYSGLSDIVGAINDAKFTGVNIATGSSITGNGLSTNKLGLASSAEDALIAVDNKLDKTAIVTATIDNTNYVTAVNINSTNIPIKDTSFWEVTAATGTTASNNTWQHYISTTNTFNYYKMVIHPNGTSSAQEWANDGIIHIILEA